MVEPHEITVTPEMIAAGVEAFEMAGAADAGWLVELVYRAMAIEAPPSLEFDPNEITIRALHAQLQVERMAPQEQPCVTYRPVLTVDGNKWQALYGDGLENGVAGYGNSPAEAMTDFDAKWVEKLQRQNVVETTSRLRAQGRRPGRFWRPLRRRCPLSRNLPKAPHIL